MNIKLSFLMLLATLLTACKLEVYTVGEGTVSIAPSQQGKVCESSDADLCYEYSISKDVTVHATPKEGYQFASWSLAECGNSNSCTIPKQTTDKDLVLTATFAKRGLLEVYAAGEGTFSVDSSQQGEVCKNSNAALCYRYDTSNDVTVHAFPHNRHVLSGWSLPECGTNSSCTIPRQLIEDDYALTATFSHESLHGFKATWKLGPSGVFRIKTSDTDPQKQNIPVYDYNYTVYWDDGTISTNLTGDIQKNFSPYEEISITIAGTFPHFEACTIYSTEKLYTLISVEQWGNIKWKSMRNTFGDCTESPSFPNDAPDISELTDMSYMFKGIPSINWDISDWDTSNITNMSGTFSGHHLFNQDISGWDTSSVTDMSYMFSGAEAFNMDVSGWNTSNVTDLSHMFSSAGAFNGDISGWDTSKVTDMVSMFSNATSFNQDIGGWDTSSVIDVDSMFKGAIAFNQDIGDWDTSSIWKMRHTFSGAAAFNQDISGWDTSNVSWGMSGMFEDAITFNQNIGGWDTSNVRFMDAMFSNATAFNQDIGNWDTSKVQGMNSMFKEADAFNQDIGRWDTSDLRNMAEMFSHADSFNQDIGSWKTWFVSTMKSTFAHAKVFNQDISAWNTANVENMDSMFESAKAFNQDIGDWDIEDARWMRKMFSGSALNTANYDSILNGWWANTSFLEHRVELDADAQYSSASINVRAMFINKKDWVFNDGGCSDCN